MTEPTNTDRADWGRQVLEAYGAIIGSRWPDDVLLPDLLTDLRHLCDADGLDFEYAVTMSAIDHAYETAEVAR